ncbi:glycosyltransferase family 9 protein [Psychroserpens sp. XS_ASV72]|uniref:glycosyltransferase family 9 protein n=1 Tax=Psychroserpens sp. XS_ASV72 TaxID=3241293 RepID=UPI0035130175
MSKPIQHILVIRLSAMGDVAMSVPVLRAFTEQYPDIKLSVLTKPFFKPLFRDISNLDVVEADVKGKHKGVFGLYRLSKTLKQKQIEAIADLHNVLRSKLLRVFLFSIFSKKIDKGRTEKKALVKGNQFEPLKSTHQRYADVFENLGFPIDLSSATFPKPYQLNQKINQVLGGLTRPMIGIAPFAAFEGKAYPLSKMEDVIRAISKSVTVVLFGSSGQEATQLQDLEDEYQNVINIAGKLNLNEELDLISNLDLMVSMDSGNAHLAAMLGVEVITIWGVTHPYAGFYPFHQDPNNAVLADRNKFPRIPTSVYGNSYPEGYEQVFETITPDDIISKVKTVLKKKPHSKE